MGEECASSPLKDDTGFKIIRARGWSHLPGGHPGTCQHCLEGEPLKTTIFPQGGCAVTKNCVPLTIPFSVLSNFTVLKGQQPIFGAHLNSKYSAEHCKDTL